MGHLKDESDEVKAIDRIRLASPIAVRNRTQEFVTNALVLPLEYHADFVKDSNSFLISIHSVILCLCEVFDIRVTYVYSNIK